MELASGHIDKFMKTHTGVPYSELGDENKRFLFNSGWLMRQVHALAEALREIHRPKGPFDLLGYHHDIKSHNILYFTGKTNVEFRFTDWSSAKICDIRSEDNLLDISSRGSDWPAYLPYETLESETTCRSDIWSLGRVFVELLLWLEEGWSAVDQESETDPGFRQRRRKENEHYREELESKLKDADTAALEDFDVFYGPGGAPLKSVLEVIDSFAEEDLDNPEEIEVPSEEPGEKSNDSEEGSDHSEQEATNLAEGTNNVEEKPDDTITALVGLLKEMLSKDPANRPMAGKVCFMLEKIGGETLADGEEYEPEEEEYSDSEEEEGEDDEMAEDG